MAPRSALRQILPKFDILTGTDEDVQPEDDSLAVDETKPSTASQSEQRQSKDMSTDDKTNNRDSDTRCDYLAKFILTVVCLISLRCFRGLWITVLVTGSVAWLIHQFYWRRKGLPPGPMPLPFVGNVLSMDLRHPAKTFASLHAQYGPIFTVWMPNQPMVVLASYDVLKEALIKKGPTFAGRTQGYIWSMFTKNQEHGDGIILCEGERWAEIREFAHKIFRSMGLGRMQMEDKIKTHISGMLKRIDQNIDGQAESVVDMEEPISLCVAHIIQDFVMGKVYDTESPQIIEKKIRKFKRLIDKVLADVASKTVQMVNAYPFLAWLPIPALRRYKENGFSLQRYFLHAIHEHAENLSMDGEPRDFIEAYLREMHHQKSNPHFNHMTLALASGDLWTGGMETTVTTLRWGIIYMLYHPEVQRRCHEEVDTVFGAEPPSYGQRKKLPFVEATIAELLRIVNVLPWAIPHRTTEDVELSGFYLPRGTTVLPQYGTVQFDTHYFDEPEKFRPERFLDAAGVFKKRPELNPFGMGKRTCLGENLARYELFLIFTTLLQKYDFLPIEGQQLPSMDRSEGMTNVPKQFNVRLRPRHLY